MRTVERVGYETLLIETDRGIAKLTINRPEKRNALDSMVRKELIEALDELRDDPELRVLIITGAGDRAFVAGADIGEFATRSTHEQWKMMRGRNLFEEVASFPRPVIAMINGYALGGGCELALACDLRIAGRSARLGQPEVNLGLIPGGGGTQRLPRLIGLGRAMRLIMTGELIDAEEAERIGLVDQVVEDEALESTTRELAERLSAHSPLALQLIKEGVRATMEMPLSAGLRFERELFVRAFGSEDRIEGTEAFLEKRRPEFKGR